MVRYDNTSGCPCGLQYVCDPVCSSYADDKNRRAADYAAEEMLKKEKSVTAKPNYTEIRKKTEAEVCNVHEEYKGKTLDELKSIVANDRLPFSVMCLNLTGDLNIGTIIRTAHILGAERVFVVGRGKIDNRSLVGADKYFPVIKIDAVDEEGNIDCGIVEDIFNGYNLNTVLIETGGESYLDFPWKSWCDYEDDANKAQICLVVGNEGMGIPEELKKGRRIVSIPQRGCIRSLNVSSAFAIVASHMVTYFKE